MVQGFYFAKPMRSEDFVEYMDNHKTLHGDVVKTVSESVLDPDKWWEVIRADCEPVLEMSDCFTLCDKADDDLIETIMASDSYYELIESSREEVYNTVFNVYDYVHEDDKQKVRDMFNSVDNYHTIGRVMYRRLSGDTYRWFYLKVRLLEKNDTHGVYFCVIDNVTDLME